MFNNLLSLFNYCSSRRYLIKSILMKDMFAFNIFCDDEQILNNLSNFISFNSNTNDNNENILFYFVNHSLLPREYDKKLDLSPIIKIHGGTPEQHMYANKYCETGLALYRINSGKPQYILHDYLKSIFVLFGDSNTLKFDLLRIVREVYYRKCLCLGRVAFHAACVANKSGECVLISGNKSSGKTTLLCNILHNTDLLFIDNDRVMLGVCDGKIIAHSMSSTVNIAYGTLSNYSEISPHVSYTDKIKLNRFDFIEKMHCESTTIGFVKGIIFPKISKDYSQSISYICDAEETMQLFLSSVEKLDNSEHPDWLNIANINTNDYNSKVKVLIETLYAIEAYKVFYGYDLLSNAQIKTFCKI